MTSAVRFMHHPTSQPCRTVHQFLLEVGIPFEDEVVDLIEGDNEQQSFKDKYNPTGQVPILVDGDFVVWESAAIGYYPHEKYEAPAQWFGRTMQQRAIVQQYLHWHSTYLDAAPQSGPVSQTIMEVGRIRQPGDLIPMNRRTSLAKGTEIIPGGVPA